MNILLISDDPERVAFDQILKLKKQIESLRVKRVDLASISQNGIFFNSQILEKNFDQSRVLSTLEKILKRRIYSIIVISLRLDYLKKIFLDDPRILDLIGMICPRPSVFVFGASSILSLVRKKDRFRSIQFYHRLGVAKLTQEFKDAIINHITASMTKEP